MYRWKRAARFSAVLILVFVGSCGSNTLTSDADKTVLLISLDGFRSDFIEQFDTPHLDRITRDGVHAEDGMIPVFPTLTFPNHYSIATGLYPANHGIVSNTMYDAPTDSWFRISDRAAVENSMWWEGEPIWVTAENQGVRTATYYWVGSEAKVKGVQPTYWRVFDGGIPGEDRVDQVLAWLDLPDPERPSFVAFYFENVDGQVHGSGTSSRETAEAVATVDRYIGRLLDGLESRGTLDQTDIIVVSDHGMTDRSPEKTIVLEDYVRPSDIEVINTSPVAMMNARGRPASEIVSLLENAHPSLEVYLTEDLPEDLHFNGHHRIPEIIAIADEGWTIFRDRAYHDENAPRIRGATHGYHPHLMSMRALFLARGPSFAKATRIESFEAVHIYPLLAHLLGLEPAETDGDLDVLRPALRAQN